MVILQFDATCSALCKATEQYREDISIHCLQCLVQGYKEQYREDIVYYLFYGQNTSNFVYLTYM